MINKLLLTGLLFLAEPTSENIISEPTSEEVSQEEEEQKNIEQIINDAIDGKLNAEELKTTLESITKEEIDKVLSMYIADEKERSKINGIIYAGIVALVDLLVIGIYLSKVTKEGKTASLNNKTFTKVADKLKKQVNDGKEFLEEAKREIKAMNDRSLKSEERQDQAIELANKLLALSDNSFKSIMGILEVAYEGQQNEEGTPKEESNI